MSHLRNLAKVSSRRAARSIWLAGTSRPWFLARTPRTMFTTSRRSSVEPNQQRREQGEKQEPFQLDSSDRLSDDGSRPPWIYFSIMFTLTACLMGFAVYTVYDFVTIWPEALRNDLRQGVKHRNKGNLSLSIQHLQQAWEMAKSLPLNSFGSEPLLKTSGIAIVLAGVLEDDGKKEEAYKVYKEALWQLQSAYVDHPPDTQPDYLNTEALKLLSASERIRIAALAYKLSSMASELGKPEEEEEKWLLCSVDAIYTVLIEEMEGSEAAQIPRPPRAKKLNIMATDMRLPSWASHHDLAAPFEVLGTMYKNRPRESRSYDFALPLYLQAIAMLIPPPPLKSSPEDRIRGARLMKEVSLLLLVPRGGLEDLARAKSQAISWSQKALDVVIDTRQSHKANFGCDSAYLELLYHLAILYKFAGQKDKARELYETCVKESIAMGYKGATEMVEEALQTLDSEIRDKDKDKNEDEDKDVDEDRTV